MYISGPTPELFRAAERQRRERLEIAASRYRHPLRAEMLVGSLAGLREGLGTFLIQAGKAVMPTASGRPEMRQTPMM